MARGGAGGPRWRRWLQVGKRKKRRNQGPAFLGLFWEKPELELDVSCVGLGLMMGLGRRVGGKVGSWVARQ